MNCHICDSKSQPFATARIMNKYDIQYFRCGDCGFVQTEEPFWLEESYQSAIIDTDVGLVARNEKFAGITSLMLRYLFPEATCCVDYGGGYGMMTRMLRDRGHDFRHFDPYCENLFAKGFETLPGERHFDLLTAFEVWEHMANPIAEIDRMNMMADHWLVSTHLLPSDCPRPGQWWYYALEGGQHVSIWTHDAMLKIARRYDRQYVSLKHGLHLLSAKPVQPRLAKWITKEKFHGILDVFRRRETLTVADYQAAARRVAA